MPSEAAAQFNIHDAKTNSSRIIERVERGEEIIISRAGNPVAKVVPLTRRIDRGWARFPAWQARGCRRLGFR